MTQQIRGLLPSLAIGSWHAHGGRGTNWLPHKLPSDLHMRFVVCVHPHRSSICLHAHTHTDKMRRGKNNILKVKLLKLLRRSAGGGGDGDSAKNTQKHRSKSPDPVCPESPLTESLVLSMSDSLPGPPASAFTGPVHFTQCAKWSWFVLEPFLLLVTAAWINIGLGQRLEPRATSEWWVPGSLPAPLS